MSTETPLIRQYLEIKNGHQDCILLFRLGDFYEMFFEDAKKASKVLQLVLTSRGKTADGEKIDMCGIPHHASKNYISRLLQAGYKVAICEQVEDASASKGITKREVVRILSPATLTDDDVLVAESNNYLVAVYEDKKKNIFSLACVDASTGDFLVSSFSDKVKLADEIYRLGPSELLLPDDFELEMFPMITRYKSKSIDNAEEIIKSHFKIKNIEAFGLNDFKVVLPPASAIIDYLKKMDRSSLDHINKIKYYGTEDYVYLDKFAQKNLELIKSMRKDDDRGTLVWVLNKTKTSMGSRLLKKWISQPLRNIEKIKIRQNLIQVFIDDIYFREELLTLIENVYDVERILARLANNTANPRDLVSLGLSLKNCSEIFALIRSKNFENQESLLLNDQKILQIIELSAEIQKIIVDEPPVLITEGGIIRRSVNAELDELFSLSKHGQDWIMQLENSLQESTGIKKLKIGYNRVTGYFIEVSKANANLVPENFIRKQTLVNAERYITEELKQKESDILSAADKVNALEYDMFCRLRNTVSNYIVLLQEVANKIANIDVIISLAVVAQNNNYVRPQINNKGILNLKDSRHPVVELNVKKSTFVANDAVFDDLTRFIILTGPNMSGKSTYMRQICLVVIMGLIGSYVPAKEANIPIIDRVFTRIGASDDLFAGESTFMVEMNETANIINNATKDSLIILDEIGRGTSTFDGMSIAASVAEYLYKVVKAKTIFATHYHELTGLSAEYDKMKNFNVSVYDQGGVVDFLHKVVPGCADKSYGIHVAQMAGLPEELILRAKEFLYHLEKDQATLLREENSEIQMGLFDL